MIRPRLSRGSLGRRLLSWSCLGLIAALSLAWVIAPMAPTDFHGAPVVLRPWMNTYNAALSIVHLVILLGLLGSAVLRGNEAAGSVHWARRTAVGAAVLAVTAVVAF